MNPPYVHVWNTVVTSGLVPLVATWNCQTSCKNKYVVLLLAASLEPLADRRNVASLSLFYRYYFGRFSSELAQLVPLPFSRGRCTLYSDRLHDFLVTIPRCYKDGYVNSFFSHTARLWISLPMECFPLTYDLSGLKGCVHYIFAGLFFKSKRERLSNQEKSSLFHFKSSFRSRENQILKLYIFKFHDVIKCLRMKQEIHFTE